MAGVGERDTVIEIGPGRGALTEALASRVKRVIAIEVDRDLLAMLEERFSEAANVTLVEADVLDMAPDEVLRRAGTETPYQVVANLPYNVAAPILRLFLESVVPPTRLTVMVQLEVAESLASRPGRMTLLGVATQVYADARIMMRVAPGSFTPPPAVQSAVVRLDVLDRPRVRVELDKFFRVVRAGFGNPRKQLRNSLSFGLNMKQESVDAILGAAGVAPTLRPHVLSIDQWESITRAWLGHLKAP